MSPQFRFQLTRLIKANPYNLDSVREAIELLRKGDEFGRNVVWSYYYPVSIQKAYDFFKGDEEVAMDAAFQFMEHFVAGITNFTGEGQQLSKFYDVAAQNYFTNYYNRVLLREPDIVYGHEQAPDLEDDFGTSEDLSHITKPAPLEQTEDYPYDGVDTSDPETQAVQEEDDYDLKQRVLRIRDKLTRGDQEVYDLLLQDYNSDEICERLGRTVEAIENSFTRIRRALP